jgi:hypothetical protein
MNKNINIKEKNIMQGEKANPQNCAIARALKEQYKKELKNISVLPSHVVLELKKGTYTATMPKEGINFIKRFDRGLAVNPFDLKLRFKKDYALV